MKKKFVFRADDRDFERLAAIARVMECSRSQALRHLVKQAHETLEAAKAQGADAGVTDAPRR